MTESFLWLPSLEGPTYQAAPSEALSWIKDWTGELRSSGALRWRKGGVELELISEFPSRILSEGLVLRVA